MPPPGIEPAIPARERPLTQALGRAATGTDIYQSQVGNSVHYYVEYNFTPPKQLKTPKGILHLTWRWGLCGQTNLRAMLAVA